MEHERIPTDDPIRHIWNRLALLSSFSGAKTFLRRQAIKQGVTLREELLLKKAQGLAFSIRSANEYFKLPIEGNLTSACLAYYYGTFSLLKALLLSSTKNEITLDVIEKYTQYGHGLSTMTDNKQKFPSSEKIMVLNNGFLTQFLRVNGYDTSQIEVSKRYSSMEGVNEADMNKIFNVKDMIARVPELKGIYVELFQDHPEHIKFNCSSYHDIQSIEISFPLYKNSKYLTHEKIREILGWPSTITFTSDEKIIKTEEMQNKSLIENKKLYESAMADDCYVRPLLGIDDVLLFNFIILYSLSIWVRYRPALWRDICEGDLDLYRPLFTNFLISVERIVPNMVLDRIYQKHFLFAGFPYLA